MCLRRVGTLLDGKACLGVEVQGEPLADMAERHPVAVVVVGR